MENTKPADAPPTRPIGKDDLKKMASQLTPSKIAHFRNIPVAERQDWQALGPILDRLIAAQK